MTEWSELKVTPPTPAFIKEIIDTQPALEPMPWWADLCAYIAVVFSVGFFALCALGVIAT